MWAERPGRVTGDKIDQGVYESKKMLSKQNECNEAGVQKNVQERSVCQRLARRVTMMAVAGIYTDLLSDNAPRSTSLHYTDKLVNEPGQ